MPVLRAGDSLERVVSQAAARYSGPDAIRANTDVRFATYERPLAGNMTGNVASRAEVEANTSAGGQWRALDLTKSSP
jgi:hypothetical protein